MLPFPPSRDAWVKIPVATFCGPPGLLREPPVQVQSGLLQPPGRLRLPASKRQVTVPMALRWIESLVVTSHVFGGLGFTPLRNPAGVNLWIFHGHGWVRHFWETYSVI